MSQYLATASTGAAPRSDPILWRFGLYSSRSSTQGLTRTTLEQQFRPMPSQLRIKMEGALNEARLELRTLAEARVGPSSNGDEEPDALTVHRKLAVEHLRASEKFKQDVERGIPWGVVMGILKEKLPVTLSERDEIAYHLVADALGEIVGPQGEAWHTEYRETSGGNKSISL